jgi:hypothetical protein
VDVTAFANWAGAYAHTRPTHIVFASVDESSRGSSGLETLFHEAMHGLEDSIRIALSRAGASRQQQVPQRLSHAIIFYTAGEVVRRTVPGHVPYAERYGVWQRGWGTFRAALSQGWQPYLEGKIELDAAVNQVLAALVARRAGS